MFFNSSLYSVVCLFLSFCLFILIYVFSVAASFPWSFCYNCCFGFRHVKVYCNSDNALASLIREIRNASLHVPGFQLCELEEFMYVASTF